MENQSTSNSSIGKKIFAILLVIAIIIVGATLYVYSQQTKDQTDPITEINSGEFSAEVRELGLAETLSGFPADLPMQTGNQVLKNYEAESNDGRLQSTKRFTTSLTVAQALQTYTNFFVSKDWVRNVEGALQSPVLMRRGENTLIISVSQESTGADTIVEITLTQNQN